MVEAGISIKWNVLHFDVQFARRKCTRKDYVAIYTSYGLNEVYCGTLDPFDVDFLAQDSPYNLTIHFVTNRRVQKTGFKSSVQAAPAFCQSCMFVNERIG